MPVLLMEGEACSSLQTCNTSDLRLPEEVFCDACVVKLEYNLLQYNGDGR